ncbi:hypothetical protein OAH16_01465 [bacterium]|nr:hypothetical protein [bacterium]
MSWPRPKRSSTKRSQAKRELAQLNRRTEQLNHATQAGENDARNKVMLTKNALSQLQSRYSLKVTEYETFVSDAA